MNNGDVEKENTRFQRISRRVFMGLVVLTFLYLTISTYAILKNTPAYMHDWRGPVCIVLIVIAFVIYATPTLTSQSGNWPPPFYYSASLYSLLYLVVFLLSLIDHSFLWDFYLVYGFSFALFTSRRLLLAICIIALTLFAFQGLLTWPLHTDALFSIAGQCMALFSAMGSALFIQYLIGERFQRNKLLLQLHHTHAELQKAHHRLEQSAGQEQELAVLRERTRLAREMHDTLGHALVLIAVKLEAAQRLRERAPERCDRELESTKEIARESMTALRASIANLRSPALEREPIQQALGRSTRELAQRVGLCITYTFEVDIECLPESDRGNALESEPGGANKC